MKRIFTLLLILTIAFFPNLIFAQNQWQVYTTSNSGICSDTVMSIFIDNSDNLWFGTMRGVSKFDRNSWTSYTSSNSPFTEDAGVNSITKYDGNYYFSVYNLWSILKFDGNNWSSVPGIYNVVSTMAFDNYGNLWMGDYNTGVTKYDGKNTENFNRFNSSLPSSHVTKIIKDHDGNIWVAMIGDNTSPIAGIAIYDGYNWQIYNTQNSIILNDNIHCITEDKDGNLWFGAENLLLIKFDGENWFQYNLGSGTSSGYISAIDVDLNGNIWAGLGGFNEIGLIKFDGSNVTRYGKAEGFPGDGEIYDVKADRNNNIWIGTWNGLIKLNNAPNINVETLSGTDSLKSLSSVNLIWNYNFINNVNIEYSIDNGTNWKLSAGNVTSDKKYFSWIVPIVAPASEECLIRISEINNPEVKVESGKFTIYAEVETPVFTPDGGAKNNGVNISISCATDSSEIYYTTDGTEPTQSSTKYSESFYINKNITLKAKAFRQDWIGSEVKSSQYQMKAARVTFDPQPGTYSYAQQVSLKTLTDSTVIHYTINGSDPDQESAVYSDPINISINSVIKAIAYRENFDSSIISIGTYDFSGSNITAVIKTDSVWLDTDFDGYAEGIVDGSESSITNDNFYYMVWFVNGDSVASGAKVKLKLQTGTSHITLITRGYKYEKAQASFDVNVYASKLKTNGGIYSAPAQLDNKNFIITSSNDKVYQFDSTGTINWNILTGGDIQSTTPCITYQNNIYVGSTDTRLYSFNQDGVPNWDKAMGGIITSSPSVSKNGVVYVGINTGRLYAMDETGNIKWFIQTEGGILSSPAVSLNGDVYIGSLDKKLYSVNKDGNVNWTYNTGDTILSSPAIGDDSCIVFGSNDGYLYKLTPEGNKKWSYFAGGKIESSPIILNHGEIIFGDSNGEIICVGVDGGLAWKYITSGPVSGTAAISVGGQIIIGDEEGVLYNLDPLGILLWSFQTGSPIVSPILITENNLAIFGDLNGDVYTLKLDPRQSLYVEPVNYAWPTFKENNKRTGNKSAVLAGINNENSNEEKEYKLAQNYPNPFNPTTTINYSVPKTSLVTIKIYDVLGNEVSTLLNTEKSAGYYKLKFNANNLASGIYFYRMKAGDFISTKKLILLK